MFFTLQLNNMKFNFKAWNFCIELILLVGGSGERGRDRERRRGRRERERRKRQREEGGNLMAFGCMQTLTILDSCEGK